MSSENEETIHFLTLLFSHYQILLCCFPPPALVLYHQTTEEQFLATLNSVSVFFLEREEVKQYNNKS